MTGGQEQTGATGRNLAVALSRVNAACEAYQAATAAERRQKYVRYLELRIEYLDARCAWLEQRRRGPVVAPEGAGANVVPFPVRVPA